MEPVPVRGQRGIRLLAAVEPAEQLGQRQTSRATLERVADLVDPGGGVADPLGRLEGDEPLEQGVRLVLVGEDDADPAGGHGVADHLEGDRRLALAV